MIDEKIRSIIKLRKSIESSFFRNFEESYDFPPGLNFTHMKTAIMLHIHGRSSMSELCSHMLLEKGSFTPVAGKLIKHELVKKERCSRDKRISYLMLTEKGQTLADSFFKAHMAYMKRILEGLSPEEQDEYFDLIKRLNGLNEKIKGSSGKI